MEGGGVSDKPDQRTKMSGSLGLLRPTQDAEVLASAASDLVQVLLLPQAGSGDNVTLGCSSSGLSATRGFLGSKASPDHVRKSGFQHRDNTLGGHPSIWSTTV